MPSGTFLRGAGGLSWASAGTRLPANSTVATRQAERLMRGLLCIGGKRFFLNGRRSAGIWLVNHQPDQREPLAGGDVTLSQAFSSQRGEFSCGHVRLRSV